MAVKYDAKDDGGTILVPADQVTKLRMALASGQSARRRRGL
jgi:flagellar biosynthesis/type III secretory pathway M-ring protein FliF/YscJ